MSKDQTSGTDLEFSVDDPRLLHHFNVARDRGRSSGTLGRLRSANVCGRSGSTRFAV